MYIDGTRRLDYVLGDDFARSAVVQSGALGEHGGVTYSDHTLQWVDFSIAKLFGMDHLLPVARNQ